MKTWVLLLRGVMPTGRNRVPMTDLRAALTDAGLQDVQTYIQSGNVVARTALARAALERHVHDVIAASIGADIAVVARTHGELAAAMAASPFSGAPTSQIYYTFLAARPAAAAAKAVLATDFGGDRFHLDGLTLHTCYATKASDSRFTNNWFERKLGVVATTRNHNTTARLVALSA